MLTRILGFIAQNPWLIIIVLGGLFNLGVRLQQKANEQRARRAALAELQRRKAEALRTGKPMAEPTIVYDQPKAPKQALENRQARLEALRQKRIEQLRAMRQKQLAEAIGAQAPSDARPGARSGSGRSVYAGKGASAARQSGSSRRTQPTLRPRVITGPQKATPPQQTRPVLSGKGRMGIDAGKRASPSAAPSQPQRPPVLTTPAARSQPVARAGAQTAPTRARRSGKPLVGAVQARSLLRDRDQLRQAIVLKEILDAPIALRDPETVPGAMPI